MEPLNPAVAIIGGLLIGTAAALLLLLTGRIAGVSGMAAALIALFLRAPEVIVTSSVPLLIAAGLLVGFGTRLGNGCTSGHGVCGMARLSPRSIAATATFMMSAAATVFIIRHLIGV